MSDAVRVELFGPVPRHRLQTDVNCVRAGRRTSIWDANVSSSGRMNARATAILASNAEQGPDAVRSIEIGRPEDGQPPSRRVATSSPFFLGIEFRVVEGEIGSPGPARLWTRVTHRWFPDRDPCGLARLVAVADVVLTVELPVGLTVTDASETTTCSGGTLTAWNYSSSELPIRCRLRSPRQSPTSSEPDTTCRKSRWSENLSRTHGQPT